MIEAARNLPAVKVPTPLRNPHPLVNATRQGLEGAKVDYDNLVNSRCGDDRKTLAVCVGKASVGRGLAYLDTLIKMIEMIGGTVSVQVHRRKHWERETIVSFCGEAATAIRLRERYKLVPKPKQSDTSSYLPKYDHMPTGRLLIDANSCDRVYSQDTDAGGRIEDDSIRLIVRWVEGLGRSRTERRKHEEEKCPRDDEERVRRAHEAELDRKRQELRDQQNAERARVKGLLNEAVTWRKAQVLRDNIRQVEHIFASRYGQVIPGSEFSLWLTWARQQADRLDLLTLSPPSILDKTC